MFEIYLNTRDVSVWYQCWSLAEERYLVKNSVSMHPRFQVIPTLITTLIYIYIYIYIKKKERKRKKKKNETIFLSMSLYFIIFLVNKFLNLNGIRNRVFLKSSSTQNEY